MYNGLGPFEGRGCLVVGGGPLRDSMLGCSRSCFRSKLLFLVGGQADYSSLAHDPLS